MERDHEKICVRRDLDRGGRVSVVLAQFRLAGDGERLGGATRSPPAVVPQRDGRAGVDRHRAAGVLSDEKVAVMISQTAEYALRAIVFLARRPGGAHNVEEIAGATKSPADYLSKILRQLARAGFVRGQRGLNGGFSLARPAHEISVLDVVHAVDPSRRIES